MVLMHPRFNPQRVVKRRNRNHIIRLSKVCQPQDSLHPNSPKWRRQIFPD